jgi:branched-chain amino acid transport system permease protein
LARALSPTNLLAGIVTSAGTIYAILFADEYGVRLLTLAGIYALAVIGYQIVFGHGGAISLAQGAFFGLGGYVSGLLAHHLSVPFFIGFPVAILAAGVTAGIIALPVLRLESHYLALATLGLAELAVLAALSWEDVTGGANGLAGVPPIDFGGPYLGRGLQVCAFVWLLVGLGAWSVRHWLAGFREHAFTMIRADPIGAAASGLAVGAWRAKALIASAMLAAAAGALNVHTIGIVSPDVVGFPIMVTLLAMTVIGGHRQIGGAIIAALLLVHLPEWFRVLDQHYLIAFGAAMLACVVLAPDGVGPALARRLRVMPSASALPRATSTRDLPRATSTRDLAPARDDVLLLEITGLTKRFGGVTALSEVTLSLRAGEIVGLIGPNGSGKSTLLNVMCGLEGADAGRIRLAGEDVLGRPPHRIGALGIGRSFQTPAATGALSALDAITVACGATGTRYATARDDALALLAEVGAEAFALEPCASLPPSLRRRIDIARALARSPRLVLLDEPAAGLGPEDHLDLALRLRRFAEHGIAFIIVEHNLPFLLGLADRVVCLSEGQIIASGTPADVRADGRVIDAYFGSPGRLS